MNFRKSLNLSSFHLILITFAKQERAPTGSSKDHASSYKMHMLIDKILLVTILDKCEKVTSGTHISRRTTRKTAFQHSEERTIKKKKGRVWMIRKTDSNSS